MVGSADGSAGGMLSYQRGGQSRSYSRRATTKSVYSDGGMNVVSKAMNAKKSGILLSINGGAGCGRRKVEPK
jgi:hypothetical protein